MLGSIDGQRMASIMNEFTRAFFDHYLSNQGAGLDEAFRARFPEVTDVDVSYVRDWAASNPQPGFMSYTHVFFMNRLLAADADVAAKAAELDRAYSLVYELADGPKGETVWWDMRLDPQHGVSFSLQQPKTPGDLHLKGDYAEFINTMKALKAGEQRELPVTPSGNENLMDIIGEVFAAAQKAATIQSVFP